MENILNFEMLLNIENEIIKNIDLLEIAKDYCEFNAGESDKIINLSAMLDIILEQQRNTVALLENSLIK